MRRGHAASGIPWRVVSQRRALELAPPAGAVVLDDLGTPEGDFEI